MNTTVNIPWNRYALTAELAKRLDGLSPQFGKTALQKVVFFLQEVYGMTAAMISNCIPSDPSIRNYSAILIL